MTMIQSLEAEFKKAGIGFTNPGFYDDPAFIKRENIDPDFLQEYAAYVMQRNYGSSYLAKVEQEIPLVARIINSELIKEGRFGACVDYSMLLSRVLEKRGIWNYIVKGSLTIQFPEQFGIKDKFFWSFDPSKEFAAAHAWVVAPPFDILDVTVKQQQYPKHETTLLPDLICARGLKACEISDEDLMSYDLREDIYRRSGLRKGLIEIVRPDLPRLWKRFLPLKFISENGIKLKYIPVGIAAPDTSFERSTLRYHGVLGIDLFNDIILKELEK